MSASKMDRAEFVRAYGHLYENAPWVAEQAHAAGLGPEHDTAEGLHRLLAATMLAAPRERRLELIRAHPDLAGKLARPTDLTASSRREQASAGLDALDEAQTGRLAALNAAYREKFGFPFILAVAGLNPATILGNIQRRLGNDPDREFDTALEQINRIARLRLEAL